MLCNSMRGCMDGLGELRSGEKQRIMAENTDKGQSSKKEVLVLRSYALNELILKKDVADFIFPGLDLVVMMSLSAPELSLV